MLTQRVLNAKEIFYYTILTSMIFLLGGNQEGKGNGHFALLNSVKHKRLGVQQADAYEAVGFKKDARDFSSAAKILKDIGVKSIRMLTNNDKKIDALRQHGIEVVGIQKIEL
jgi:GTP cyclohydrolase II